jgi:hypothetical protein
LKEACETLLEKISLCVSIKDSYKEMAGRQDYGLLLAYESEFKKSKSQFEITLQSLSDRIHRRYKGVTWAFYAILHLLASQPKNALEAARITRQMAESEGRERDIIRAEWLLGAALVAQVVSADDRRKTLTEADTHLTEALTRCRQINLVELEPDILLSWARWHQLQGNAAQARADAGEALMIADRCEYRLKQADIHNFLARLALQAGDRAAARRHAETARERAWCDGPPHCYKPALDEADRLLAEIG